MFKYRPISILLLLSTSTWFFTQPALADVNIDDPTPQLIFNDTDVDDDTGSQHRREETDLREGNDDSAKQSQARGQVTKGRQPATQ